MNIKKIVLAVILVAIFVLSPTVFYNKITAPIQLAKPSTTSVVRLWHIDGFVGGKSSRGDFLQRQATEYEKAHKGNFVLVVSHTLESAKLALKNGDVPDAVSYGLNFSQIIEYITPHKNLSFADQSYAYPWCFGAYGVFSLRHAPSKTLGGKTVISSAFGGAAAVIDGITVENAVFVDQMQAYVDFLNGKYDFLIGSQRDIARFNARQVQVNFMPINSFSDMFQYISITTQSKEKMPIVTNFITRLLSQSAQQKLSSLYLLSVNTSIYQSQNLLMFDLQNVKINKTLMPFLNEAKLLEFEQIAKQSVLGDAMAIKKLNNFTINV